MLKTRTIICMSKEKYLPLKDGSNWQITTNIFEIRSFETIKIAEDFCKVFTTFRPVVAEFEMFIEKIL